VKRIHQASAIRIVFVVLCLSFYSTGSTSDTLPTRKSRTFLRIIMKPCLTNRLKSCLTNRLKTRQQNFLNSCLLSCALIAMLSGLTLSSTSAENQIITLGTGGVTGLYYPAGGALCRLINQTRQQHGIRCAVRSTLGSVTNVAQVTSGALDLGIAEAGQLYKAAKSDVPLRTLVSLFPEYISVLVRTDAGINSFADLKNKRINIGKEGSSQRLTIEFLMAAQGWKLSDFAEVTQLEPSEQATALCENRIDATLYVVGHPSGAIKEALRDCRSKLIGLSKRDRDTLILKNPYYRKVSIAGNYYSPNLPDVETVGVNATLFTRADLPDDVAYAVVKSLFAQFDSFRRLHPAFSSLDPEQMMLTNGLPQPLHPGAAKYFMEAKQVAQAKQNQPQ
jgi:TRAP transporter TAXI family solute receptor